MAKLTALFDACVLYPLIESEPGLACAAIRRMRERYKNPQLTASELMDSLSKKGLPRSADLLRNLVDQI